jgi:hypothetical protein
MFSVSIILNEGTNSADSVGTIQFTCVGLEPNGQDFEWKKKTHQVQYLHFF